MELKNRFTFLKQRRWQYVLLGFFLSFIGPLGEWIFIKIFSDYVSDAFLLTYVYTEIAMMVVFIIFGYILGTRAEKIEELAFHDNLTGLYNRHYLMEQLHELTALHTRYKEVSSIILFDLDCFKKVNDTFGHSIGDKTLKAVAASVMKEIRTTDFASRTGGDEFLIVCPHTNIDECYKLAERIRIAIENLKEDKLGCPGPQAISAGIYELSSNHDVTAAQMLNNVDQALYRAKQGGRNKVVIYDVA